MKLTTEFILIDDDPVNNMLSEIIIEEVIPDAKVVSFTNPREGLDYVLTHCIPTEGKKCILFLDLNMPILNGWEFMDHFTKSDSGVKDKLPIYILSSSVDPADLDRVKNNPLIKDFIEKPLTEEGLNSLISA